MNALVGYTGFVGSNIYAAGKIDRAYNSKNISEAFGSKPDLLIYAGLRAEKYLANKNPDADMETVRQAMKNIENISPKKLVLISTIDVFKQPAGKNEGSEVDIEGLSAYGLNRYRFEQWTREKYPDALIIRLPGLFGMNIKKNFIYDFIHVIPSALSENKFDELAEKEPQLREYYALQENGFYKHGELADEDRKRLKALFMDLDFTALNFTDSRNVYQFYPLSRLRGDIQTALVNNLQLLHPATEPVSAAEVYTYLTGKKFENKITETPAYYDYRSNYAELFGGSNGYLMDKQMVLTDIKRFVEENSTANC
ncbi:MAG: sugar nucleotide-binding protein [Lachnospiraceae bacterium]|nr:sugar nucleotide-binding protein [Lachnospiraceae bacterium]